MTNLEQLRNMRVDELHHELERLRKHFFDLRSQAVTEKLENPMQLRKTRKEIARVLTILTEKGARDIEQHQAHLTAQAARRA